MVFRDIIPMHADPNIASRIESRIKFWDASLPSVKVVLSKGTDDPSLDPAVKYNLRLDEDINHSLALRGEKALPMRRFWFDAFSSTLTIYLPAFSNCRDVRTAVHELDRTVLSEVISRKGLEAVLSKDDMKSVGGYTFDNMQDEDKKKFLPVNYSSVPKTEKRSIECSSGIKFLFSVADKAIPGESDIRTLSLWTYLFENRIRYFNSGLWQRLHLEGKELYNTVSAAMRTFSFNDNERKMMSVSCPSDETLGNRLRELHETEKNDGLIDLGEIIGLGWTPDILLSALPTLRNALLKILVSGFYGDPRDFGWNRYIRPSEGNKKDEKHPYDITTLSRLVTEVAHPLAVFLSHKKDQGAGSVMIETADEPSLMNNFLIAVNSSEINENRILGNHTYKGSGKWVNKVCSAYPISALDWIKRLGHEGYVRYLAPDFESRWFLPAVELMEKEFERRFKAARMEKPTADDIKKRYGQEKVQKVTLSTPQQFTDSQPVITDSQPGLLSEYTVFCTAVESAAKVIKNFHNPIPVSQKRILFSISDLSKKPSSEKNVDRKTISRLLNLLHGAGVPSFFVPSSDPSLHPSSLPTGRTVLGYSDGRAIFLSDGCRDLSVPVHEYTHVWVEALRIANPLAWEEIKSSLRGSSHWERISSDPAYSQVVTNEDALASEVLAFLSSADNAEKVKQYLVSEGDEKEKEALLAMDSFWEGVTGVPREGGAALDEHDITRIVLSDLLSGRNFGSIFTDKTNDNHKQNSIFARHEFKEGHRPRRGPDGGRREGDGEAVDYDPAPLVALSRDLSRIRVFTEGLSSERGDYSGDGEGYSLQRQEETAESERLIRLARENGFYYTPQEVAALGDFKPTPSKESKIYFDSERKTVYKVKDPFATASLTKNIPQDAIYAHIYHNVFFPETRYSFVGITDVGGDARIILSQEMVPSIREATDKEVQRYLKKCGIDKGNDKYSFTGSGVGMTDCFGANALVDKDGTIRLIDPLLSFRGSPLSLIKKRYGLEAGDDKMFFNVGQQNIEEKEIIAWHGSSEEFTKFDLSKSGKNGLSVYKDHKTGEELQGDNSKAIFLTTNREAAVSYALLGIYYEYYEKESMLEKLLFAFSSGKNLGISSRDELVSMLENFETEIPQLEEIKHILQNEPEKKFFRDILPRYRSSDKFDGVIEKIKELRKLYYNRCGEMRSGGLANMVNNTVNQGKIIESLLLQDGQDEERNIDRLRRNDLTVNNRFGTFGSYDESICGKDGNSAIYIIADDNGRIKVIIHKNTYDRIEKENILPDSQFYLDTLTNEQTERFIRLLKEIQSEAEARVVEVAEKNGYTDKLNVYKVAIKLSNPLEHDYEGSSFVNRYKKTKYETSYVAARQVRLAREKGYDSFIYKNIRDPFLMDTYGVFDEGQIHIIEHNKEIFQKGESISAENNELSNMEKSVYRVIIAGSRDFSDYETLCQQCDAILSEKKDREIVVVSGTARGADKLGERYAHERGYRVEQYPADWDRYGKSAGYKRNTLMSENADALIAFWDGKSHGTQSMINIAYQKNLDTKVVNYVDFKKYKKEANNNQRVMKSILIKVTENQENVVQNVNYQEQPRTLYVENSLSLNCVNPLPSNVIAMPLSKGINTDGSAVLWNPEDKKEFGAQIHAAFDRIYSAIESGEYDTIVIPKDGFVDGVNSRITRGRTPVFFDYLNNRTSQLTKHLLSINYWFDGEQKQSPYNLLIGGTEATPENLISLFDNMPRGMQKEFIQKNSRIVLNEDGRMVKDVFNEIVGAGGFQGSDDKTMHRVIETIVDESLRKHIPAYQKVEGVEQPKPSVYDIIGTDKTQAYGVELSSTPSSLLKEYQSWLNEHPNGIVAYREMGKNFFTVDTVNDNIIGNPFNWTQYNQNGNGEDIATEMFYTWLHTGDNQGNAAATVELRDAIIAKLKSLPEDAPVLYYKDIGKPSHATILGYLIRNKEELFGEVKKQDIILDNIKEKVEEPVLVQKESNDAENGINENIQIAPNGQASKLSTEDWSYVRTPAFIESFGDWEKAYRLEKLRQSESISIEGNEVTSSDDIKEYRLNALKYAQNLRGVYTNEDTGRTIHLFSGKHGGIKEVLEHDYKNVEHLQSVAAIPEIIEKSIFIDSRQNEEPTKNSTIIAYDYFVCGLKIAGEDYTVKAVIGRDIYGDRYYDHKLTSIEKGKLLDKLALYNNLSGTGLSSVGSQDGAVASNPSPEDVERIMPSLSDVKDTRLLSILQTESTLSLDENFEPTEEVVKICKEIDSLYARMEQVELSLELKPNNLLLNEERHSIEEDIQKLSASLGLSVETRTRPEIQDNGKFYIHNLAISPEEGVATFVDSTAVRMDDSYDDRNIIVVFGDSAHPDNIPVKENFNTFTLFARDTEKGRPVVLNALGNKVETSKELKEKLDHYYEEEPNYAKVFDCDVIRSVSPDSIKQEFIRLFIAATENDTNRYYIGTENSSVGSLLPCGYLAGEIAAISSAAIRECGLRPENVIFPEKWTQTGLFVDKGRQKEPEGLVNPFVKNERKKEVSRENQENLPKNRFSSVPGWFSTYEGELSPEEKTVIIVETDSSFTYGKDEAARARNFFGAKKGESGRTGNAYGLVTKNLEKARTLGLYDRPTQVRTEIPSEKVLGGTDTVYRTVVRMSGRNWTKYEGELLDLYHDIPFSLVLDPQSQVRQEYPRSITPEEVISGIEKSIEEAATHPDEKFCLSVGNEYVNDYDMMLNGYLRGEFIEMLNEAIRRFMKTHERFPENYFFNATLVRTSSLSMPLSRERLREIANESIYTALSTYHDRGLEVVPDGRSAAVHFYGLQRDGNASFGPDEPVDGQWTPSPDHRIKNGAVYRSEDDSRPVIDPGDGVPRCWYWVDGIRRDRENFVFDVCRVVSNEDGTFAVEKNHTRFLDKKFLSALGLDSKFMSPDSFSAAVHPDGYPEKDGYPSEDMVWIDGIQLEKASDSSSIIIGAPTPDSVHEAESDYVTYDIYPAYLNNSPELLHIPSPVEDSSIVRLERNNDSVYVTLKEKSADAPVIFPVYEESPADGTALRTYRLSDLPSDTAFELERHFRDRYNEDFEDMDQLVIKNSVTARIIRTVGNYHIVETEGRYYIYEPSADEILNPCFFDSEPAIDHGIITGDIIDEDGSIHPLRFYTSDAQLRIDGEVTTRSLFELRNFSFTDNLSFMEGSSENNISSADYLIEIKASAAVSLQITELRNKISANEEHMAELRASIFSDEAFLGQKDSSEWTDEEKENAASLTRSRSELRGLEDETRAMKKELRKLTLSPDVRIQKGRNVITVTVPAGDTTQGAAYVDSAVNAIVNRARRRSGATKKDMSSDKGETEGFAADLTFSVSVAPLSEDVPQEFIRRFARSLHSVPDTDIILRCGEWERSSLSSNDVTLLSSAIAVGQKVIIPVNDEKEKMTFEREYQSEINRYKSRAIEFTEVETDKLEKEVFGAMELASYFNNSIPGAGRWKDYLTEESRENGIFAEFAPGTFLSIDGKDYDISEMSVSDVQNTFLKEMRKETIQREKTDAIAYLYGKYLTKGSTSLEISTAADEPFSRLSALNLVFKPGTMLTVGEERYDLSNMSVEHVYQNIIKQSGKGLQPGEKSILYNPKLKDGETVEDFSYRNGFLPLYFEALRQNPELFGMVEKQVGGLARKSRQITFTDQYASETAVVSQAHAMADIMSARQLALRAKKSGMEDIASFLPSRPDNMFSIERPDIPKLGIVTTSTLSNSEIDKIEFAKSSPRNVLIAPLNQYDPTNGLLTNVNPLFFEVKRNNDKSVSLEHVRESLNDKLSSDSRFSKAFMELFARIEAGENICLGDCDGLSADVMKEKLERMVMEKYGLTAPEMMDGRIDVPDMEWDNRTIYVLDFDNDYYPTRGELLSVLQKASEDGQLTISDFRRRAAKATDILKRHLSTDGLKNDICNKVGAVFEKKTNFGDSAFAIGKEDMTFTDGPGENDTVKNFEEFRKTISTTRQNKAQEEFSSLIEDISAGKHIVGLSDNSSTTKYLCQELSRSGYTVKHIRITDQGIKVRPQEEVISNYISPDFLLQGTTDDIYFIPGDKKAYVTREGAVARTKSRVRHYTDVGELNPAKRNFGTELNFTVEQTTNRWDVLKKIAARNDFFINFGGRYSFNSKKEDKWSANIGNTINVFSGKDDFKGWLTGGDAGVKKFSDPDERNALVRKLAVRTIEKIIEKRAALLWSSPDVSNEITVGFSGPDLYELVQKFVRMNVTEEELKFEGTGLTRGMNASVNQSEGKDTQEEEVNMEGKREASEYYDFAPNEELPVTLAQNMTNEQLTEEFGQTFGKKDDRSRLVSDGKNSYLGVATIEGMDSELIRNILTDYLGMLNDPEVFTEAQNKIANSKNRGRELTLGGGGTGMFDDEIEQSNTAIKVVMVEAYPNEGCGVEVLNAAMANGIEAKPTVAANYRMIIDSDEIDGLEVYAGKKMAGRKEPLTVQEMEMMCKSQFHQGLHAKITDKDILEDADIFLRLYNETVDGEKPGLTVRQIIALSNLDGLSNAERIAIMKAAETQYIATPKDFAHLIHSRFTRENNGMFGIIRKYRNLADELAHGTIDRDAFILSARQAVAEEKFITEGKRKELTEIVDSLQGADKSIRLGSTRDPFIESFNEFQSNYYNPDIGYREIQKQIEDISRKQEFVSQMALMFVEIVRRPDDISDKINDIRELIQSGNVTVLGEGSDGEPVRVISLDKASGLYDKLARLTDMTNLHAWYKDAVSESMKNYTTEVIIQRLRQEVEKTTALEKDDLAKLNSLIEKVLSSKNSIALGSEKDPVEKYFSEFENLESFGGPRDAVARFFVDAQTEYLHDIAEKSRNLEAYAKRNYIYSEQEVQKALEEADIDVERSCKKGFVPDVFGASSYGADITERQEEVIEKLTREGHLRVETNDIEKDGEVYHNTSMFIDNKAKEVLEGFPIVQWRKGQPLAENEVTVALVSSEGAFQEEAGTARELGKVLREMNYVGTAFIPEPADADKGPKRKDSHGNVIEHPGSFRQTAREQVVREIIDRGGRACVYIDGDPMSDFYQGIVDETVGNGGVVYSHFPPTENGKKRAQESKRKPHTTERVGQKVAMGLAKSCVFMHQNAENILPVTSFLMYTSYYAYQLAYGAYSKVKELVINPKTDKNDKDEGVKVPSVKSTAQLLKDIEMTAQQFVSPISPSENKTAPAKKEPMVKITRPNNYSFDVIRHEGLIHVFVNPDYENVISAIREQIGDDVVFHDESDYKEEYNRLVSDVRSFTIKDAEGNELTGEIPMFIGYSDSEAEMLRPQVSHEKLFFWKDNIYDCTTLPDGYPLQGPVFFQQKRDNKFIFDDEFKAYEELQAKFLSEAGLSHPVHTKAHHLVLDRGSRNISLCRGADTVMSISIDMNGDLRVQDRGRVRFLRGPRLDKKKKLAELREMVETRLFEFAASRKQDSAVYWDRDSDTGYQFLKDRETGIEAAPEKTNMEVLAEDLSGTVVSEPNSEQVPVSREEIYVILHQMADESARVSEDLFRQYRETLSELGQKEESLDALKNTAEDFTKADSLMKMSDLNTQIHELKERAEMFKTAIEDEKRREFTLIDRMRDVAVASSVTVNKNEQISAGKTFNVCVDNNLLIKIQKTEVLHRIEIEAAIEAINKEKERQKAAKSVEERTIRRKDLTEKLVMSNEYNNVIGSMEREKMRLAELQKKLDAFSAKLCECEEQAAEKNVMPEDIMSGYNNLKKDIAGIQAEIDSCNITLQTLGDKRNNLFAAIEEANKHTEKTPSDILKGKNFQSSSIRFIDDNTFCFKHDTLGWGIARDGEVLSDLWFDSIYPPAEDSFEDKVLMVKKGELYSFFDTEKGDFLFRTNNESKDITPDEMFSNARCFHCGYAVVEARFRKDENGNVVPVEPLEGFRHLSDGALEKDASGNLISLKNYIDKEGKLLLSKWVTEADSLSFNENGEIQGTVKTVEGNRYKITVERDEEMSKSKVIRHEKMDDRSILNKKTCYSKKLSK